MICDNSFFLGFKELCYDANRKHFYNLESSWNLIKWELFFFNCESFTLVLKQGNKHQQVTS